MSKSCYVCLAEDGTKHVVDCPLADGHDPWAEDTKPTVAPGARVAESGGGDLSMVVQHSFYLGGDGVTFVCSYCDCSLASAPDTCPGRLPPVELSSTGSAVRNTWKLVGNTWVRAS